MPRAFQRIGQFLAIIALLTAFGAHWIVLQSVAWTTMLVNQSRTTALVDAVEKTFDGRHPCSLCRNIEQGRKSEKKQEVQVVVSKLNLLHPLCAVIVLPAIEFRQLKIADTFSEMLSHAPPVPPPRDSLS